MHSGVPGHIYRGSTIGAGLLLLTGALALLVKPLHQEYICQCSCIGRCDLGDTCCFRLAVLLSWFLNALCDLFVAEPRARTAHLAEMCAVTFQCSCRVGFFTVVLAVTRR